MYCEDEKILVNIFGHRGSLFALPSAQTFLIIYFVVPQNCPIAHMERATRRGMQNISRAIKEGDG